MSQSHNVLIRTPINLTSARKLIGGDSARSKP